MTQQFNNPAAAAQQGGGFPFQQLPEQRPAQPAGFPAQQQPAGFPAQQPAAPQQDLGTIRDLLSNAGGTPGAFNKHSQPGDMVTGRITRAEVRQVTDYETGEPEWWQDGQPKLQLQVVVQTGQTSPEIENDTGERAIYIKWWGEQRQQLLAAIRAAGDDDIRPGGQFLAKFAGTKPNEKNPRLNDIKVFEYAYEKPGAGIGGLAAAPGDQAAPQQQPAAPAGFPAQPAPQQPAPQQNPLAQHQQQQQAHEQAAADQDPWGGGQAVFSAQGAQQPVTPTATVDVNRVREFIGMGLDDQSISGATGATMEQVAAIRAQQ